MVACRPRRVIGLPVRVNTPVEGSYNSALGSGPISSPTSRTLPLGSSVAEWLDLGVIMDPVAVNAPDDCASTIAVGPWQTIPKKSTGGIELSFMFGSVLLPFHHQALLVPAPPGFCTVISRTSSPLFGAIRRTNLIHPPSAQFRTISTVRLSSRRET